MVEPSVPSDARRWLAAFDEGAKAAELRLAQRRETEAALLAVLPLLDTLDRLAEEARLRPEALTGPRLAQALELFQRQAFGALATLGVAPMHTVGGPVDLERHEVGEVRPGALPDGRVVGELLRGFLWQGRVLRRARVVVNGVEGELAPGAQRPLGGQGADA